MKGDGEEKWGKKTSDCTRPIWMIFQVTRGVVDAQDAEIVGRDSKGCSVSRMSRNPTHVDCEVAQLGSIPQELG
jgi:hypothetical protein